MQNKIPYFSSNGLEYLDINEITKIIGYTEEPDKLYHFTNLDSFIKIWLSRKLLFSDRSRLNDVAEKNDMVSGNCLLKMQAYLYAVTEYKQISLSKRFCYNGIEIYKSPLMWGVYANHATGVCIEFDKDKLMSNSPKMICADVKYCDYIPNNSLRDDIDLYDIKSIDDARTIVDKNIEKIFFWKSEEWKFENEFRVISRKENYLDISNCITRIYLFNPDSATKEIVYNLVNEQCEIKIVFLSSIFKTERILDTYTLKRGKISHAPCVDKDFQKWIHNDSKLNYT